MSAVSSASQTASILHWMGGHVTMNSTHFFEQFGHGKAKCIGTDENAYSEDDSITSVEIGDCITVFALEKEQGKIKAIMSWHFGDGTAPNELRDEFDEYVFKERKYELYIIGGDENTTQENNSLLYNIHQAIDDFFEDHVILKELVNLNAGTEYEYVSANLQMDGTLTYCQH